MLMLGILTLAPGVATAVLTVASAVAAGFVLALAVLATTPRDPAPSGGPAAPAATTAAASRLSLVPAATPSARELHDQPRSHVAA